MNINIKEKELAPPIQSSGSPVIQFPESDLIRPDQTPFTNVILESMVTPGPPESPPVPNQGPAPGSPVTNVLLDLDDVALEVGLDKTW